WRHRYEALAPSRRAGLRVRLHADQHGKARRMRLDRRISAHPAHPCVGGGSLPVGLTPSPPEDGGNSFPGKAPAHMTCAPRVQRDWASTKTFMLASATAGSYFAEPEHGSNTCVAC